MMIKNSKMKKNLVIALGCVYAVGAVLLATEPVYATQTAVEISTEDVTEMSMEVSTEGEAMTEGTSEGLEASADALTMASVIEPTIAPTQAIPLSKTIDAIVVDGDLSEWKAMSSQPVLDNSISEWKITKSPDGSMVYLCFGGIARSEWDTGYIWKVLNISYSNGTSLTCQFASLADTWGLPGAQVATYSNASGTNPGRYGVECALPMQDSGYAITFAGTTISEEDIPEFVPAGAVEPVYNGIVIDGNYDDWAAVARVEASCPNTSNHRGDCLSSAACVFDGDYVYIYLQNGDGGSAAGAGANSNGRYSITTDMGRQVLFQLSAANGGTINGIQGAKVAYFGDEWEIAIPATALPVYKQSISFGLYQEEPFVSGIMDLQGGTGTAGEFQGIVYDGLFGDWASYPHTLIQYATSGTQTDNPDGEGALYVDGSTLYGHVVSSMDAHLAQRGGEFSTAVSICFNGERGYNGDKTWNLYPRLVAVDADGTINWSPKTSDLENGLYEFYIADIRGEYNPATQTNIADLGEHEQFFGRMMIHVGDMNDEMEFYVDLEQVAEFLSYYSGTTIEASDFKLIEAQFGQIGSDYLSVAGTSSGPYMGVGLCMAFAGAVLLKRKRNKVVE